MLKWEVMSEWNLNEQNFDSKECLSENDKKLLSKEWLLLKKKSEKTFNDILLNDDHEYNNT